MSVGNCKDPTCKRPMVGAQTYRSKRIRAAGFVRHSGHGLCRACYMRARTHGTLPDPAPRDLPRRPMQKLVDWVEDYAILRREGLTRIEMARALSMSLTAFDRAICRARKSGRLQ